MQIKQLTSRSDVMEREILPTKIEDECPPLSMLIYGARNIILPTLLFEQMSDLLILLATIDFWRTKLLQKMTTILTWNKIYESDPSEDVRTLSGDQRRSLESHVRPKTVRVLRGMYRALFHRCVHWVRSFASELVDRIVCIILLLGYLQRNGQRTLCDGDAAYVLPRLHNRGRRPKRTDEKDVSVPPRTFRGGTHSGSRGRDPEFAVCPECGIMASRPRGILHSS